MLLDIHPVLRKEVYMSEGNNPWKESWQEVREGIDLAYPGKGEMALERIWAGWDPSKNKDILDLDALCTSIEKLLRMDFSERRAFLQDTITEGVDNNSWPWNTGENCGLDYETAELLFNLFLELEGLQPATT